MDRITQKTPVSDFLGAILQKARAREQGGEDFQALLENAVSNRKRPEQKASVERPETESPEQKLHRKQRGEQAAKTEPAEVSDAQQPDENTQLAQAAVVQQPVVQAQPAAAQTTVQAMSTQAAAPIPQAANPVPEAPAANGETVPAQAAIPEATQQQEQETIIIDDPAQQKFDSMVQKAAQELETAKQQPAVPVETAETAETADTAEPIEAAEQAPEPEQPADQLPADEPEDPQQKQPAEQTQPRAVVQQATRPQVSEQRPLGEIPEEDRSVLELVRAEAAPPPPPEQRVEPEIQRPADVHTEPVPQPIRMPDQTERIRTEITRSLAQERMEFTMRLEPETLGKVDVRMILEGGRLVVEITAASQKTAEMLQRQTDGLAASLRLGNMEVQSIQVTASQQASSHMDGQFGLESGHNRGTQQENSGGQHRSGAQQDPDGSPADNARGEPEKLMDYAI